MKKILCICLSSTIQRTVLFDSVYLNSVNRSKNYLLHASGKAVNSARVLNQLERDSVKIICPLGSENKDVFLKLAEEDRLDVSYIEIPGKTRECWTLLDKNAGTTTEIVVSEPACEESIKEEEEMLLKLLDDTLDEVDGVLFAGSTPQCFRSGFVALIVKIVKERGKFFIADYCGKSLHETLSICTPDIIKINEEEYYSTFCNSLFLSETELERSIVNKSNELKNGIIVTRGKKSTYAAINGKFYEMPCENVKAVNTTACGDSFTAGFLYEYLNTFDFREALAKATWCAARNAENLCPGSIC